MDTNGNKLLEQIREINTIKENCQEEICCDCSLKNNCRECELYEYSLLKQLEEANGY